MSLMNALKQKQYTLIAWLKTIRYDWYVLIGLLLLSILGVGITDASQRISHWYWMIMVPVFFSACLFIEWRTTRDTGSSARVIVIKQVQHWSALLVAVYGAFFLRNIGSLDNQTTGLVLLLLFALTTFLAGVTMGWLFRLLGIFLALSLYFVAYMEHYIQVIMWTSLLILIAYHFLVRYFGREGVDDDL